MATLSSILGRVSVAFRRARARGPVAVLSAFAAAVVALVAPGAAHAQCEGRWLTSPEQLLNGPNSFVTAFATLPNGDLVVGGEFTTAGGVAANNIAQWNGASWAPLGSGVNGLVYALAALPNGDLVAGGVHGRRVHGDRGWPALGETGEIDETAGDNAVADARLDPVTGRSRGVGHDRRVAADEGVEQAALADVGPTEQHDPRQARGAGPAAGHVSGGGGERVGGGVEPAPDRAPRGRVGDGHGVGRGLVGEVDGGFDIGEQVEQVVADRAEPLASTAGHAVEREGQLVG
jgi:hypothetical protein